MWGKGTPFGRRPRRTSIVRPSLLLRENAGVSRSPLERYADTDEKGIFRGEGPYIAWFKDPAGNTLSVLQEK